MFKNKLVKKSPKTYEDIKYTCSIRFLDDSESLTVSFQKEAKGQWLIDTICTHLNLVEKDYFGLRFVDTEKQRHWLDPTKVIYRQLRNVSPVVLCFRVKFYPADPMKLKEEITRYFLFLQLRRDLHHGRLLCSPQDAIQLAAYIIQSEVGDYDPEDHNKDYVAQFKMLPKQNQKQEEKIAEAHKNLSGQVPSESESNFLKKACTLDTYGVDPHAVKDQKGNQMYLGVTHLGIVTFQGNKRTHLFKWDQVNKIALEGKMFIVHVTVSEGEENSLSFKRKKHACGFKCQTFSACKHLWKCAIEQQYFFTLHNSTEAPKVTSAGGWFTRGAKFRYSGRCQKEVYTDSEGITREPPNFTRSASNPQLVRTLNKSRSATLPSKLRQARENDQLVDKIQRSSASDIQRVADEEQNLSIPEEVPVVITNTPYEPIDSPVKEDLPPIPMGQMDGDVPEKKDLDAQIQELTKELELEKGKVETGGIVVETPVVVEQRNENHVQEKKATELKNAQELKKVQELKAESAPLVNDAATPDVKVPSSKKSRSCVRALLVSLFVTFVLMGILAFLVLETAVEAPMVTDIREMPEVQDFKSNHYDPFKLSVSHQVGGWFKQ